MTLKGRLSRIPRQAKPARIDHMVLKDGEVVKSVEVTSKTADKTAQEAKEERIRDAGGNYVQDRSTGELVRFPAEVKTEVRRKA